MANSTVLSISPDFLLLDTYSVSDENLISNQEVTSTFNPESDYVEYYVYGLNNSLLYPSLEDGTIPYSLYSILDGDVYIDPSADLERFGFDQGSYNVLYNFYSNRLNSSFSSQYFISEISSDRTEIRLDSNDIEDANIISSVTAFIAEREADEFYPDFLLNFGSNRTVIANNIALDGNTVLIKLYEPLPLQFGVKSTLWVVEEVSNPIAYNISFEEQIIEALDTSIKLQGPNLNLDIKDQINNSTEAVSLSDLDTAPLTSSFQQLQSLFEEEGVEINVDYTEYSNFINFSSIQARLENFEYKLQLIESYQEAAISGSNVSSTTAVSGSKVYYDNLVNDIITNFDGYEYFLYFESGSKSWPKSNSEPPYQNLATTNATAITWYNEQILSASAYDELNQDNLYYDIPEYLRNDSSNQGYIDFVEMIGQHFDNIWIYLKDISNKYDADNRIDAGISKDLVAQTLRDFSLKIYQNNFSSKDIYSSFLGLTPSGSLFPFPEMTGSLPTPSGFEYVGTFISSSTDAIPLDDVNKRIYKRLYHNLPYLLKSKGTIQGLKTLLNIYGIPDTILRISEFGGKDKDNSNDWDYWYNKFNYAYDTLGSGYISSPFLINTDWNATNNVPETIQFRFKTTGIPSDTGYYSQSLFTTDQGVTIRLNYTGSGFTSGSFSGSIDGPYNQYAHLELLPNSGDTTVSASIYLPFFDGEWWSVMATISGSSGDWTYNLNAADKIYNGTTGTQLGFEGSSSISDTSDDWINSEQVYFSSTSNTSLGKVFSGSFQEIRYYKTQISKSVFDDYVMNPLSFEGNSIASGSLDIAPEELVFRATLGGELYTGSTSIHPKVAGSWPTTSSFSSNSNFTINGGEFSNNKEFIFFDQFPVGIKNRTNDKIKSLDLALPNYTATQGAIIPNANTLSNQISIQQDKTRDLQYTNNVNLLEVTFSPQNEINDDIISQIGYFNIGDLIGDPRDKATNNTSYPELDKLRRDYFLKYVHENYDFNDYVRLIKFFDNSLFKMIKDFIPAKTSLASGITIKPHVLERQKYPEPQASWEDQQYSGSIKSFARDYETGSIQVTSGGNGGSFEIFNHLSSFTQSYNGVNSTPEGLVPFTQSGAPEFINGEFSGSTLLVEDGELNPDNPFKDVSTLTLQYQSSGSNSTNPGDGVLFWHQAPVETSGNPPQLLGYGVDEIYINEVDNNGVNLESALSQLKPGDTVTFTVRYQYQFGFGPTGPIRTRTVTQTIDYISIVTQSVWKIAFKDYIALTTSLYTMTIDQYIISNVLLYPFLNTPNFTYSDYNAILGNATDIRPGTLYQDLDYSSNTTTPVNFNQVISGSATKAIVPDSNYTTKRITLPRYEGSKLEISGYNTGSGEEVQISAGTYIGYYDNAEYLSLTVPPYPFGSPAMRMYLRYLISPEGEIIQVTGEENVKRIIEQNFVSSPISQSLERAFATPLTGSQAINSFTAMDIDEFINPQSSNLLGIRPAGYTGFDSTNIEGFVYPKGLTQTSANANLQKAEQILRDARLI